MATCKFPYCWPDDQSEPYTEFRFEITGVVKPENSRQCMVEIRSIMLFETVVYCDGHGVEVIYDPKYSAAVLRWFRNELRKSEALTDSVNRALIEAHERELYFA